MRTYGKKRSRVSGRRDEPLVLSSASPSSLSLSASSSGTTASPPRIRAASLATGKHFASSRIEDISTSTTSSPTIHHFFRKAVSSTAVAEWESKAVGVRARRQAALATVPVCSLRSSCPSSQEGVTDTNTQQGGSNNSTGDKHGDGDGEEHGDGEEFEIIPPLFSDRSTPRGVMGGVTAGKGRRSRQGARGEKQMTLSSAGWKKTTNGAAAMPKAVEGSKKEQMFLDFGQQSLGKRVLCQRCGMLYVCGSEEDEAGHTVVCAKAAKGVEFAGWKQERVKANFPDDGGRILEIRQGDPAPHRAKLQEVARVMDSDMGFAPGARGDNASQAMATGTAGMRGARKPGRGRIAEGGAGDPFDGARKNPKATYAFVYVRGKRVLGCVIAERIVSARRVLPDGLGYSAKCDGKLDGRKGFSVEVRRGAAAEESSSGTPPRAGAETERTEGGSRDSPARGTGDAVCREGPGNVNVPASPTDGENNATATETETIRGSACASVTPSHSTRGQEGAWKSCTLECNMGSMIPFDLVPNARTPERQPDVSIAVTPVGRARECHTPASAFEENFVNVKEHFSLSSSCPRHALSDPNLRSWGASVNKSLPATCPSRRRRSVRGIGESNENPHHRAARRSSPRWLPSRVMARVQDNELRGTGGEQHSELGISAVERVLGLSGGATPCARQGKTQRLVEATANMSSPASTSSISPSATVALSSRLDDMGRFMIRGKSATFVSLAENGEAEDGDLGTVDDNEVAIGARELRRAMSTDSTPSSILSSPIPEEAEEEVTPSLPRSALACEEQEIPAVVGILQMWVHGPSRREGIATRLVDTVCGKMVYGCPLRRDQIAFSQPTREGQAFASRYSGGDLLVY